MIKILQSNQIDKEKWDYLVSVSGHETIYPYSWFMDACSENWLGMIKGDYEYLMPVAYRKKYGFKYFYQPVYCQQLGVYSKGIPETDVVMEFLSRLAGKFKLGDYSLNAANLVGDIKGCEVMDSTNYILNLNRPYDLLFEKYTAKCKKSVLKARQFPLEMSEELSIEEAINIKSQSDRVVRKPGHYDYARHFFSKLESQGKIRIIGCKKDGVYVSVGIFAIGDRRLFYLMSGSTAEGKKLNAMFMTIDYLISEYAGKNYILDFEGSNIPSIAHFFRGFGAQPEIYQRIRFSNFTSKLMKRLKSV